MTAINVSDVGIERLEPVLQGQEVSFKERDKNSTGYRYTYVPVAVNEDRPGALELSEPLTHLYDYAYMTVARTVVLAVVLMLVSGFVALLLGIWMVGQPLDQIIEKFGGWVQAISRGDWIFKIEMNCPNLPGP